MRKIFSVFAAIAAMFSAGTINMTKDEKRKTPFINPYNGIGPGYDISTAKTDHTSIALNGKFNKRNNQLFKLRYKASRSYIPVNSKAVTGRAI